MCTKVPKKVICPLIFMSINVNTKRLKLEGDGLGAKNWTLCPKDLGYIENILSSVLQ